MPVTVLIWASCEVICELSIGLVGSWFFICATSSCRNVFCRSVAVLPVDCGDDVLGVPFIVSSSDCDTVVPAPPMVVLVVKEVSSGSNRERFQHQLFGGVERVDVCLVR